MPSFPMGDREDRFDFTVGIATFIPNEDQAEF